MCLVVFSKGATVTFSNFKDLMGQRKTWLQDWRMQLLISKVYVQEPLTDAQWDRLPLYVKALVVPHEEYVEVQDLQALWSLVDPRPEPTDPGGAHAA